MVPKQPERAIKSMSQLGKNVKYSTFSDSQPNLDITRCDRYFAFVPLATDAPQQAASLFNHVVSKGEQRRRHSEAERLGGLQVDE
jgi:hypothetical protein